MVGKLGHAHELEGSSALGLWATDGVGRDPPSELPGGATTFSPR
jgi:hypothetical protein